MARQLVTWLGATLALVVCVGTGLYAGGLAPPYPWNALLFQLTLLLCILLAVRCGR